MEKHELYRMTWKEVENAFKKDPVILIPLGSTEQQGPHTPTGDYRCAEAVAKAVSKRTGVYMTTCIPFGYFIKRKFCEMAKIFSRKTRIFSKSPCRQGRSSGAQ